MNFLAALMVSSSNHEATIQRARNLTPSGFAGEARIIDTSASMKALLQGSPTLDIGGIRVPLSLRINPRARRLIVRVAQSGGEVVLVAPSRRAMKDALAFAERQKGWIAARLSEQPPPIAFRAGAAVPIHGRPHIIEHAPRERRGVWVEDGFWPALCASGEAAHLPRRVEEFLKRRARAQLTELTRAHCTALGLPLPRVALRDPVTRWGSCSHASGISYSWRLVLAPLGIANYVAAHECAHLVHMNHSKAFWRLLATLAPDVRESVRWLANEGRALHRYGGR